MRKRIIKIIIALIIIITLIIIIIARNMVPKTKDFVFYLEEKYYGDSVFNEITSTDLTSLINTKESFAIFIHQPFCASSYEFNKVVATFAEENKISFYKINFEDMKNTEMYKTIKYYPSFAIYIDGEIVDYLEADSDEDLNRYKDILEFEKWFKSYIYLKDVV